MCFTILVKMFNGAVIDNAYFFIDIVEVDKYGTLLSQIMSSWLDQVQTA